MKGSNVFAHRLFCHLLIMGKTGSFCRAPCSDCFADPFLTLAAHSRHTRIARGLLAPASLLLFSPGNAEYTLCQRIINKEGTHGQSNPARTKNQRIRKQNIWTTVKRVFFRPLPSSRPPYAGRYGRTECGAQVSNIEYCE